MNLVLQGIKDLRSTLQPPAESPLGNGRSRGLAGVAKGGRTGKDSPGDAASKAQAAEEFAQRWQAYRDTNPRLRDPKALPAMMRRGVPDALRAEVWSHCLGLQHAPSSGSAAAASGHLAPKAQSAAAPTQTATAEAAEPVEPLQQPASPEEPQPTEAVAAPTPAPEAADDRGGEEEPAETIVAEGPRPTETGSGEAPAREAADGREGSGKPVEAMVAEEAQPTEAVGAQAPPPEAPDSRGGEEKPTEAIVTEEPQPSEAVGAQAPTPEAEDSRGSEEEPAEAFVAEEPQHTEAVGAQAIVAEDPQPSEAVGAQAPTPEAADRRGSEEEPAEAFVAEEQPAAAGAPPPEPEEATPGRPAEAHWVATPPAAQAAEERGAAEPPAAEELVVPVEPAPQPGAADDAAPSAAAEEAEPRGDASPSAGPGLPHGLGELIEADVMRTFPNNVAFQKMGGRDSLRRVLRELALCDAELGYCQSLNFVAAVFIMVLRDDGLALQAVRQTLVKLGARSWYTDGMNQLRADTVVLEDLVKARLPDVHRTLQTHRFDLLMVASKWFLCLYSTAMEGETLRRVWDVVLCDGIEAVFRVALATLACREEAITRATSMDDLIHMFQEWTPGTGPGPDRLMRAAYDERLVGHISRSGLAEQRRQAAQRVQTADTRLEMRQQALWRGGVRPASVLAR